MKKVPITDIASVIRSKNAGPYELTLDIMFKKEKDYMFVREICFFTKELIAHIYGISTDKIINIVYFDPAWAVKISMVRPVVSGAIGETDVYGAQQHAPLLGLTIPVKGY
ncbi:MAG TPA: DUF4387 domain-containing protein [Syntrophales bacterium]|nr:DUF4387 domain-containing protein [Syntrophales bacterium]